MSLTEALNEAAAPNKIAVLFVHGVGINDPHYADTAIRKLRDEYGHACGNKPRPELEVEAAHWIPVVEPGLDKVVTQAFPTGFADWTRCLNDLVRRINNASLLAMLPLVVSGLLRRVPGVPKANWPTLRWALTYFVGDVVAYQVAPGSDVNYQAIHRCLDEALAKLGERAPDAPLCVIAHSLGTVIASDYFYDLQQHKRTFPTPVQRGETLTFFYTLGSPLALWMVRYPSFDAPSGIPGRDHGTPKARAAAEWVNFYDPDDIIAYPLKTLNEQYQRAVDRDEPVRLGPPLLGGTPASHIAYFNSPKIIRPIAHRLARLAGADIPQLDKTPVSG